VVSVSSVHLASCVKFVSVYICSRCCQQLCGRIMPNFFLAGMSTSVVHQANVIALSKVTVICTHKLVPFVLLPVAFL
jgi:hypothetical protein